MPGNSTGQSDPNGVLAIHFVSLREIRPEGSVVVEYFFDDLPFLLTSNSLDVSLCLMRFSLTQQQQGNERVLVWEYFFSESSASIVIDETYYAVGQNISNAGIEYPVYDQSLKISIQISNWPFEGTLSSRKSPPMIFVLYSLILPIRYRREWIGVENSNKHRRTSNQPTTTQQHIGRRISQSRNNIRYNKHHWEDFIRQLCFLHPQCINWIRIGGDSILHVGK